MLLLETFRNLAINLSLILLTMFNNKQTYST